MIINNDLKSGSRIVINELCQIFNVSSSPVRDALHYLQADGLIESKHNGYYVINLTRKDIEELYEMREVLEVFAVESVFGYLNKMKLKELLDRIMNSNDEDNFKNDMEFHNFIIENCRNKRLKDQLRILANQSYHIGFKLHKKVTVHKEIQEHIKVIKAMLENDLILTIDLLKEHLRNTKKRIIEMCFD